MDLATSSGRRSAVCVLLAAAALLLLRAPGAAAQDHVALITDVDGNVEVAAATSGSFVRAAWGQQLFEGDRVRTGSDALASLLFADGNLLALGAGSSITISQAGDRAGARAVSGEYMADASDLTLHRAGQGEIGALGGLRSGGSGSRIALEGPRNTRVRSANPVLSWKASGDFDIYMVEVLTEDGVVWSTETEETSVAYPADAPALEPSTRYLWKVSGEEMLDMVNSEIVTFEVLAPGQLQAVKDGEAEIATMFADDPESSSHLYVLGSFYASEGLLDAAIEVFTRISHMHPDSAMPHEILGKLYSDVDLKDDAVQALRKAVELQKQN